tara:strand:- start:1432 stop:1977 length:546 start_codon:yes stop_codon:yes gene_type:complete
MILNEPKIIWLTGMSGVGKTYYSKFITKYMNEHNYIIKTLDGDEIRKKYGAMDKFKYEDIEKNNLFICDLCKEELKSNDLIIVSVISPFEKIRKRIKEIFGNRIFFIYIYASINSLKDRDTKSLYKMADEGTLKNLIGYSMNLNYEIPNNPNLILDTSRNINPNTNKSKVIEFLKNNIFNT